MSIINGNYAVINQETKEEYCFDNVDAARRKLMELVNQGVSANYVKLNNSGVTMRFKGRT